jgi:hypothetical protein
MHPLAETLDTLGEDSSEPSMLRLQHILAGAHDLLRVLREDGQANLMHRVAVDTKHGSGASRTRKE